MDPDDFHKLLSMPANSMKAIRVAYIVAFVMAALIAAGALTGSIVLLPSASIPLVAGIGICLERVRIRPVPACAASSCRFPSVSDEASQRCSADPAAGDSRSIVSLRG